MATFHVDAEVTVRGTLAIEADTLKEAQARAEAQDATLIDGDFFAVAEIVDWDIGEVEEIE